MNKILILEVLKQIAVEVCDKVYKVVSEQSTEVLSAVHHQAADDTIYQIDKEVEDVIIPILQLHARSLGGVVLLAEGIGNAEQGMVFPNELHPSSAALRFIIDPIDGTRGLMYNKRPGFFLAGVAPNHGENTMLSHIDIALMVELPIAKHYTSDMIWVVAGEVPNAQRRNLLTGALTSLQIKPSAAHTILGGYAQLARFFPPGREILSKIEDELIMSLFLDEMQTGRAVVFEDQYISSGGQLYELLMGHDRFIADLRPQLYNHLASKGVAPGHVCHPYDVCTFLIGKQAGLIFTDGYGKPFDAPMNLLAPVSWCGYANAAIQKEIEQPLLQLIKKYLL